MVDSIYNKLSEERKRMQEEGTLPEWYSTGAWQMFKKKYLFGAETWLDQIKRICKTAAKHTPNPDYWEPKFFELFWKNWLSPSTPILANTGTTRGLPVACSGCYTGDSVPSFYETAKEIAVLSQKGFGTSAYLGDIRPRGSAYGQDGKADGIMPVVNLLTSTCRHISQGSSRRGSGAWYYPIDGGDFHELLAFLEANPDDLNIGWNISDAFIERLKSGDEEAISRFQEALKVKMTVGKGYFFFVDKVNRARPDMYKDQDLDVKASQLCVTGDQRVPTSRGLLTVSELYESGEDLVLFDNDKVVSSTPMTLIKENTEVLKIVLANGMEHRVTPEHKVKTKRGMVEAQDLTEDDAVFFQTKRGLFGEVSENFKAFQSGRSFLENGVPKFVWECDRDAQYAFIFGVLAGQSSAESSGIEPDYDNIQFNNINHIRDLQLILHNLGFTTSLDKDEGFLRTFESSRQEVSKVLSVEPDGVENVYCVTVDSDEHLWVCNGIVTSNCSEIFLHSSEDYTYTCILSSMNVYRYDEWKDTDAVFTATVFLDCICSEFIEQAKDIPELSKAIAFTEKGRALGLGQMGLFSLFQKRRISPESFEAHRLNIEIAKNIAEQSDKASEWMAKEWGEPEWCKGYGKRNTHVRAIAPTKSTALLMGGWSEGINPEPAMAYSASSAAGDIDRASPVLVELIKEKGLDVDKCIKDILGNSGSVRGLPWLTDEEQSIFKTAFEINQEVLVRYAACRQPYVDQGQSTNLFFGHDAGESEIARVHQVAFLDERVHSLYYVYSSSELSAETTECEACQ